MAKKKLNIDDLLEALKNSQASDKSSLENTKETWRRVGEKDPTLADDVGIETSELSEFLKEWVEDNPYSNI